MEKRKFRFNVIDALIILVVIAAVGVLAYVFASEKGDTDEKIGEKVKIQYVLQTTETREQFVKNITASDIIYDDESGKVLGTVVSVTDEPAYFTGTDNKNAVQVISEIEGKRNMFITVEADAEIQNSGYTVDGFSVKVGGTVKLSTPNLIANSNIVSVEVVG